MSGFRFRPRAGVRFLALTVALAAVTSAGGQPAPNQPGKTVYLVLRTGPQETEGGLLGTLKDGIKASGGKVAGEPTIKTVSLGFLEELESLAERASGPVVAAKEGPSVRLLPSRDPVYEVKLAPSQTLDKFRVTYAKAGEKEYIPAAPGTKSPLMLTVPGRYAFTPEPNDVPVSYSGDVSELGQKGAQIKGDWPKSDKCFVVTMRNFEGDVQQLFDTIKDGNKVANPIKNVRRADDIVFAFASLNSDAAQRKRGKLGADSQLTVTVETLPDRNPARVWVYFPLDEKQMADTRDSFNKLEAKQVPAEIRKNVATAASKVGPKSKPQWFELPADPATPAGARPAQFTRKIQLEDLPGLAKSYPRVWWLVVWEFDDGTARSAIKVQDAKGNPVSVLEEELVDWQNELSAVPTPKPAPPKP